MMKVCSILHDFTMKMVDITVNQFSFKSANNFSSQMSADTFCQTSS